MFKIAKSAQVFPKATELAGVECNLSESIGEGGYGMIYKGNFQSKTACIKAVRGTKTQILRVSP
jgi:hypothetical protein